MKRSGTHLAGRSGKSGRAQYPSPQRLNRAMGAVIAQRCFRSKGARTCTQRAGWNEAHADDAAFATGPDRVGRRGRCASLRPSPTRPRHRASGPGRLPPRPPGAVHRGADRAWRQALGHRRSQPARAARGRCPGGAGPPVFGDRTPWRGRAHPRRRCAAQRVVRPARHARSARRDRRPGHDDRDQHRHRKGLQPEPGDRRPRPGRLRHPPRHRQPGHADDHARRAGRRHSPPRRRCADHDRSAATTWPATATPCASCWCSTAAMSTPPLARRIEADIGLPNSMVDRIVPAATPESLGLGRRAAGPARRSGDRLRAVHAVGHRRPLRRPAPGLGRCRCRADRTTCGRTRR